MQVLAKRAVENIRLGWIRRKRVRPVLHLAGLCSDEPTAPAIFELRAVIRNDGALGCDVSSLVGDGRPDEDSRYARCGRPLMALDADVTVFETRFLRLLLREGVELNSLAVIGGGNFDQVGAANEPDRYIVGEIDGAGVLRRNLCRLKAGFGKHQSLRFRADAEILQQARKVSQFFVA